jgi:hypothetical protein
MVPIVIPPFVERPFDLELLIPYFLEIHNTQFPVGDRRVVREVDVLLIPYLHDILTQFKAVEIESLLLNVAEAAEDGSITFNSLMTATYTSLENLRAHLMTLNWRTLAYLGIDYWFEPDEAPNFALDHPLNDFLAGARAELHRQLEELQTVKNWREAALWGLPDFVVVDAVKHFDVADIGVAARNVAFWSDFKGASGELVDKCLGHYKQGKTDLEIQSALGFFDRSAFQDWLCDNHLDIKSRQDMDVIDRRSKAQDALFGGSGDDGFIAKNSTKQATPKSTTSGSDKHSSQIESGPSGERSDTTDNKDVEDGQRELPVLTIYGMAQQVLLNGEEISLESTHHNKIGALVFLLQEQKKTKKPVAIKGIVRAAKGQSSRKPRVYDLFKRTPIEEVLESKGRGLYWLNVDMERSKVS